MFPRCLDRGSVSAPPQDWCVWSFDGRDEANGEYSCISPEQCLGMVKETPVVEGGWKATGRKGEKVHAKCNLFLVHPRPCCLRLLFHRHRGHGYRARVGWRCLWPKTVDRCLLDGTDTDGPPDEVEKMLLERFLGPHYPQEARREFPHNYDPRRPRRPAAEGCDVRVFVWKRAHCWGMN